MENTVENKTLFVEPHEFGHVMLHTSAFLESNVWKNKEFHFLLPNKVVNRLIDEEILKAKDAVMFCPEQIIQKGKFLLLKQAIQAIRVARKYKCNSINFQYLDYHLFIIPIVRLFCPATHISGVFFRPMLHYKKKKYPAKNVSYRYMKVMWTKNVILLVFLRLKILNSCFFQDEGAIELYGGKLNSAFWIPTPINDNRIMKSPNNNAKQLQFLFFGQVSKRKGIYRILSVWKKLPNTLKSKIVLSIIGRTHIADRELVSEKIADLKKEGWLINFDDRFVANEEIPEIYKNTSIVLSPHDHQFGTSGVVVQSAIWQRPMIVHEFGWVGHFVQREKIGIAIDTSNIELFVEKIIHLANGTLKLEVEEKVALKLKNINERKFWGTHLLKGIRKRK